jgi:hypothetical protein
MLRNIGLTHLVLAMAATATLLASAHFNESGLSKGAAYAEATGAHMTKQAGAHA